MPTDAGHNDAHDVTACRDCGTMFDAAHASTCPVCQLADGYDTLDERVVDLQTAVDELMDRITREDP
jgi:RNA polymerase subunit RPABC4/transcription elongation factor Spt4